MNGLGGLNKSSEGIVIGMVQLQLPIVKTTTDLAEQVAEELKCIQDLADDKNLVFELREVLSGGKATGDVGNVNADTIDIVSLDTAIAHATKLGCKTTEAKMLLDSAVCLRKIRAAWRAFVCSRDRLGQDESQP